MTVWANSQLEAASKAVAAGLLFTGHFDDMRVSQFKAMCDRISLAVLEAALSEDGCPTPPV